MRVKRVSGVKIRRVNRPPLSTEDRVDRLIMWMNDNISLYNKIINNDADMRDDRVTHLQEQVIDLYLKIETIEEYIEENG